MLASETLHSPARAAPVKAVSAAAVTTAEIGVLKLKFIFFLPVINDSD